MKLSEEQIRAVQAYRKRNPYASINEISCKLSLTKQYVRDYLWSIYDQEEVDNPITVSNQ